jgi:hypothetical protein
MLFRASFASETTNLCERMLSAHKPEFHGAQLRQREVTPLTYHILFMDNTWNWICENFQYDVYSDVRKFMKSVFKQFPGIELQFLDVIKELGLEEQYWTREGWPPKRKRRHRK